MSKKVLALMVTFNRKLLLEESLQALLKSNIPCDILVVDNASTDGTFEQIHYLVDGSRVTYINTGENLGGAGGFNYALKAACQKDYDYFWLMDDDTIVNPDSLEELLSAATSLDDNFGYLSSFVQFTDTTPCLMNIPALSEKWYEGIGQHKGLLKVDRATFVSFFIKKETVLKYGLPIKEFFIWADDSEYALRISKHEPSYMVLNSTITHKMAVNSNTSWKSLMKENSERIGRYYYNFRNRFYLAKQVGLAESVSYFFRSIVVALLALIISPSHRLKKCGIVLKGLWAGIFFNPEIEHVESVE